MLFMTAVFVAAAPAKTPIAAAVQVIEAARPDIDACIAGRVGALSYDLGVDRAGKVVVVRAAARAVRGESASKPAAGDTNALLQNLLAPQGPILAPLTAAGPCVERTLRALHFAADTPQGFAVDLAAPEGHAFVRSVTSLSPLGTVLMNTTETRALFAPLQSCSSTPVQTSLRVKVAPDGKVVDVAVEPAPLVPQALADCLRAAAPRLQFPPTLAVEPVTAVVLVELGATPHIVGKDLSLPAAPVSAAPPH